MTQVIKNMVKRAFAMCGVVVLAFAVLASGFSAALPAVALENSNPGEKYNPTKKEVLSHGHTDVFYPIQYNGKFIMAVEKDGTTFLKPENTTLRVAKSTYTTKSQLPALATEYYYLDSSGNQKGNPLFPGWDTGYAASLVGANHADEATADIAIQQVTGPMNGRILLWTTEGVGKNSKKLSFEENDLDDEPDTEGSRFMLPGVIHQHTAGHVHANWGFTQPGVYKLRVAATITNKNTKKQITTEPAEYTFEVEDTYSGEVPASGIMETLDLHRRGDFINPDDDEEAHKASEDHKDTDKDDGGDMRIGNIRDSGPHPHYHSYEGYGGLDLKVVNKPKGARIEWRYVRADEGPDAYGTTLFAERLQLPAEPAMNKMKVYAHATEGETQVGKDTASATIAVEDHGADGHPVVKAIAPNKRFKPEDTLHAKTVLLNPHVATDGVTGAPIDDPTSPVTSIVKDYVWLIKKEGESEFKRIPGAVNSKLELKLDASMQGATIRPSLVLKNGELYRNKMFDEFCDYVIEMKGVPHSHNHDGDDDQSGSDSEDDENSHGKKHHEKRHNNRHNKRKNKTKHFAGGKNFLKGVFGGAANSGLFGSSSNGGFQFESNFFKKSNRKFKRTKKNRNKTNRTNRKNNSKNNTQSGASSGSSSFTRTENSSGTSLHNSSRRTSGGTHTKNKSSKKSGQTIRNFVRTDNNSGNKSKNSSVNNSDFVKNTERHALQGARQYNEESDEAYEDDSDDTKGDSSSIKWVAVAASGASVGLCTITGACGALIRSKLKLL